MCPVCIANTAVTVAGAGSTGGILAVCLGRFRNFFAVSRLCLIQKAKEKYKQREGRNQGNGHLAMNTPPVVSQQEWEAAHK